MGCQLWALTSRSPSAYTNATFRRLILSLRRALLSRNNGMKTGGQLVMEHLVNKRWLLDGFTRSIVEGIHVFYTVVE